jgi:hypothetical protein
VAAAAIAAAGGFGSMESPVDEEAGVIGVTAFA